MKYAESIDAYVKNAEKVGKAIMRKVANKQKNKMHNLEWKTRSISIRECLILMFKVLYYFLYL